MTTIAIVNPQSGRGWPRKNRDKLFSSLKDRFQKIQIIETTGRGHATQLAHELRSLESLCLIVVGGDGTIHEVINGLVRSLDFGTSPAKPKVILGIINAGRGGDLIRTLSIPGELSAAMNVIRDGRTRSVDIGCVTLKSEGASEKRIEYFINSCSFGLGGVVAHRVQDGTGCAPAFFVYIKAMLQSFIQYRCESMKLEVDGRTLLNGPALNVFVCNGRFSGRGMHWAPQGDMTDGLLDVVYVDKIPFGKAVKSIHRIFNGTIQKIPGIHHVSGRRVEMSTSQPMHLELDGETFLASSCIVEVLPQFLDVIVP